MKKLPITLLFLLVGLYLFAQKTISEKISTTRELVENRSPDAIKALQMLQKEISSSGKYENYTEYAKLVSIQYKGKYEEMSDILTGILKQHIGKLPAEVSMEIEIQNLWALLYTDMFGILTKKTDSLLATQPKNHQKGWLYYFRGQGNNETGDYEAASLDYHESLKQFKSSQNPEGISYAYSGLGDIQRNTGHLDKSKEYYQNALEFARNANSVTAEINSFSLMGISYAMSKDYPKALGFFKDAYNLAEKDRDFYNMARGLNNIGNGHMRMGNYSEALEANKASLGVCLQNNMDYGAIANYLNIFRINTALKDFKAALSNLDKAAEFIKDKPFPAEEVELKKSYSIVYEQLGDYKKALNYYKEHDGLRKKLVSEQTQKMVKELQIKYETEVKDAQIQKMNYDLTLKKSQNRNLWLGLGLLILSAGFSIFFLVYRNRRMRELYERNIENLYAPRFIRKESTDEDPTKKIFDEVILLLEKDQVFKKPTLSLTELAEMVGSNEKYVSGAISKYSDSNYSNLVNLYRINEAKRIIYENPATNLNDVMLECGFNSRTPFYNAFIRFTGMSPKQFKEMKE